MAVHYMCTVQHIVYRYHYFTDQVGLKLEKVPGSDLAKTLTILRFTTQMLG